MHFKMTPTDVSTLAQLSLLKFMLNEPIKTVNKLTFMVCWDGQINYKAIVLFKDW